MWNRNTRALAAAAVALTLIACGDGAGTAPTTDSENDTSIPAGASVAEQQSAARQELDRLEREEGSAAQAFNRGPRRTIVDIASANPDLSILVQAVVKADLVGALSAPGKRTVFAPTNDAFLALLADLGVASLDDIPVATLRTVLLSHVIPDANIASPFFRPIDWLDIRPSTLGPLSLEFERRDRAREFTVNGVDVLATDVRASNGIVHVIGAVLPVPDARPTIVEAALGLAAQGQFTALVAAVVKTGLVDALADETANLTVFAPTDDAFARLGLSAAAIDALTDPAEIDNLRNVLLDHVVAHEFSTPELRVFRFLKPLGGLLLRITGDVRAVNGVPFVALDAVDARNGVVHVIDGVLLPR